MKVIFLDFDGVLNSQLYDRQKEDFNNFIDESRLILLKKIVEETKAKIVLSTTWKIHWEKSYESLSPIGRIIVELFNKYEIEIIDKTPIMKDGRVEEVRAYLKDNSNIEKFVIIDDYIFGWEELSEYWIKTSYYEGLGLNENHVKIAIEFLA